MSPAISYFIFSSNGSYLRWDDDTNIDFLIRQYQMSITGGGGVDRLYVGAGTKVDAGALFASANTDELYFSGNFSDYAQTISAGGVYTFTGLAGGSHANEVVSFSMNSNGDKLVFANGHVTVKSSDYLSVSGSYSSILAGSLTIVAQTDPAIGAEPGNKPAKVFVFDAGGINIPQLPIVKEAIAVSGGGGIDKFYVRKGTNADAIGLFASAGQDVLYLTGRFNDYTQTKSAGGVYTFTRNFTGADASLTEVVNFSMNSSGDQLVFADGGVTLRLADYLSGGSYADITAAQLNPLNTTPGLLAPTPNLILASDTGSSASDRITNNATINVTGLVTGGTWQYQVDSSAWATGTASSLIASSGAHTYLVRQFDIAGNSSVVSTAVTYTLDTSPPSALGSVATSANVAENSRGEVTLTANANDMPASTSVTWSLGTGLDSALFNITSAGVLSFKTAPNYEMPRGSAFNAASNNDAYTVNVIATDAAGNASAPSAIVVNVSDVNEAPVAVGIISSRAATKNVAFSYDVSRFFSDPDTQASNAAWHTLTYTATGLPSGLTIDDSTGVISGTATAVQVASAITVTASDGGGGSGVTQTFDLEVFNGPVLSDFNVTDSVGNANFGKSGDILTLVVTMSEAVTVTPASDPGIPFSLSITFSVNGQSTSADYTSGSGSNMLTFTGDSMPVNNGSAISITSIALQRGTVTGNVSMQNWITTHTGQIYAGYTVDNTPPAAPTLMLASDTGISASDSLTNNATILVSGLETTVGTSWQYQVDSSAWATGTASSLIASSGAHTYLVRQIDAAGNTSAASAPVTYTVDNTAPTVNATTFSVAENTTAVGTLAANETVTWSLGSGADTSRFNLTNGVLSFSVAPDFEMPRGSAFDAASNNNAYTVNVTATDTAGNVKAQAIVVNVTDVNEAPTVIAPIVNQTVVVNQSFSLDVFRSFSDPDSLNRYPSGTPNWGTLTYTATGLPSGLSIAPGASDISGAAIATTASAASVTVTATDGGGLSATTTFNLSVIAVPIAPVVQSFIAKDTVGGAYSGKSGEPLFFVLTMNEPVVVNTHSTPSHAPTIVFSVNGHDVTVTYSAGTGTNILTFTGGTVPTGDGHHITLTTINLNGADVTGTLSNQGWLTTSTGQVHDNYTVDNTAPTVSKTTFSVAENTRDVATGFDILSSNENAVTWALVTGANAAADNSFFTLLSSGDLRFTNAPNFEMPRGSAFNAASNNDAYTINVTATDSVGNVGTQVLVVNVTDINEAPTLTSPARGATSVLLNQAANLNVSGDFSDPDSVNTYAVGTPQWGTLTYTTTGLPAGLSINASTGVISGTATATTASAASVTVTATDGGNMSITETFSLSVVSAPTLSTATPPSTALTGGGNSIGDTIVLTITFDGVVNGLTSGTNSTIFKVADTGVSATWSGTTGTATRTLTYTVVAGQNGQVTLDEAALKTVLVAGISDAAGNAFVYTANGGTIANIDSTALPVIDGTAPATPSLTLASDTGSNASDGLTNNVTINVSGLETGATWQYQVDGSGSWATGTASSFTAGSGAHTYLVRQTDAAGNTSVTSTAATYTLDTTAPTLSSTAPSTTLTGGGDGVGDTIVLTITFDGAVNGLISGTDDTIFKVAGTGVSATWSGTTGATTRTLTYTVVAGQNGQVTLDEAALKTVLVAGISDAAGNAFVYTANSGTIANIDSTPLPVVSTVAAAAPTLSSTAPSTTLTGGGNSIGDTIVLTITFDGAVNGLTSGTNSTIFKVADTGVSATWSGTTGTATRTLTYTVVAGQNGQATLDEVALKTALVAGITNAAGSAFVYSGTIADIDSTALPVIDGTAPTLSSTAPSTVLNGGGDSVGDTIVLTITFDGAVNGLTTGTDDTIFKVAGTGVSATWSGTTGTATRTLTYTVVAGQNGQVTLDEAALKTVLAAGITDAAGNAFVYTANSGNIADIDSTPLPVVSTVAAAAPTLSAATPPSTTLNGGGNSIGDTIVLTITFDGAVNGLTSGTNSTIFKVADTGVSATWSGTTGTATRTLTYTVAAGQNGQATLDEVALKTALIAGITNAAGSAFVYSGTIADIDSTALPVIDGTAPTLSSTAPSTALTGGGDGVGDTIVLTITFDSAVNGLISGTDNTIFKVAGAGVSATWSGTTGTATRTLTYTVAAGQNGQVTLDEAALKTVLVAGISDAAGNAFVYTANSGNIANIDSTPLPVVNTVVSPAPALVASPSLDNVTNLDVTSALVIAFDQQVSFTTGTKTIKIMDDMGTSGWIHRNTISTESVVDDKDNDVIITLTNGVATQVTVGGVDYSGRFNLVDSVKLVDGTKLVVDLKQKYATYNSAYQAGAGEAPTYLDPTDPNVKVVKQTVGSVTEYKALAEADTTPSGWTEETAVVAVAVFSLADGTYRLFNPSIGVANKPSGSTRVIAPSDAALTAIKGVRGSTAFDWDFGANYHVELDAGLVQNSSNQLNAAISNATTLNFTTVTPGIATTAAHLTALDSASSNTGYSQKMDATGASTALSASYVWVNGNVSSPVATNAADRLTLLDVSGHSVALVVNMSGTMSGTTQGAKMTTALQVQNFGVEQVSGAWTHSTNDLLYFDNAGDMNIRTIDGVANAGEWTLNKGYTPRGTGNVVSTTAAADVTNSLLTRGIVNTGSAGGTGVIAFDYLYDSSLGGGSSTAASNYRSANGLGVYAGGTLKSTLMQTDYPRTTEDGNMDLGIETDYRLGYNAVIFG